MRSKLVGQMTAPGASIRWMEVVLLSGLMFDKKQIGAILERKDNDRLAAFTVLPFGLHCISHQEGS